MSAILLVEDEAPVREALAMALEDEGFEVIQAGTAEEGLAAFGQADVSFLITDYNLPNENGDWLVREARHRCLYERPALMVTAAIRVPKLPDVEVLTKPVDLEAFISRVRAHATPQRPSLASSGSPLELVLYVGRNAASSRALQTVQRLLRETSARIAFRVVRLGDGVPSAHAEAERDRVTFAPTLVLHAPRSRSWAVGDAAIEEHLEGWLDVARHDALRDAENLTLG